MTLTLNPRRAVVMTHTPTKSNSKFKGQSVPDIEWKQTDGRTPDRYITLNAGRREHNDGTDDSKTGGAVVCVIYIIL